MISRKELDYVDVLERDVPYPGIDYSEQAMEELGQCLDLFNREYLNRIYNVTFSNNEEMEFQISKKNICHMLGINYKNLKKSYFDCFRKGFLGISPDSLYTSYDLLSSIVENKEKILEDDAKYRRTKSINYYKVAIKCAIFKKLADLSAFNYGCINFDKDLYSALYPERSFGPNATRFLYTPSDEVVSPYYMMGLKAEDQNPESYFVETLMAPENVEKMFDSQKVVIPTQIITDNNGVLLKNQATPAEKIKLLKEYQAIINQFGIKSNLDIYGDYLSQLMTADKQSKLVLK